MCQQNWDVHGYSGTCNAYQEKNAADTQDVQSMAKQKLEKWLFYYDRFNNHEVSAKLDKEMVERTEDRVREVQVASGLSWIEAGWVDSSFDLILILMMVLLHRFMKDAVDELTRCRVTLKASIHVHLPCPY